MLYFVPTPIGNKEDITLRALRLLKEASFFLCEDTRTTKKLLSMYDIELEGKEFFVLTSFIDEHKLKSYKNLIENNEVLMVSEAGTPWLSDPWKSLIELCQREQLPFSVLPGAHALIPAIVSAGFDTTIFTFLGFLPQKKGRQTLLKKIIQEDHATFFYESVHRIEKLCEELKEYGFVGKISISREISKLFEQHITGTLEEIISQFKEGTIAVKGEFVIGIYPIHKK